MHPDLRGLLNAIIYEPDRDDLRGIYADALDDHNDPERAEYIRLSLASFERAAIVAQEVDKAIKAGSKEHKLLLRLRIAKDLGCDVADLRDTSRMIELCGPHSPEYKWDYRRGANYRKWFTSVETISDEMETVLTIERGFIKSASTKLGTWMSYGPQICSEHPVESVHIRDKYPAQLTGTDRLVWELADARSPIGYPHRIPREIVSRPLKNGRIDFTLIGSAMDWLGDQCIHWAQKEADKSNPVILGE